MRFVIAALLVLSTSPDLARAQTPAQPAVQAPAVQSAAAPPGPDTHDITLEALNGATISGVVNYVGRFRTHLGEGTSNITFNYRLKVGPGPAISMATTRNVYWETKGGPKTKSLSKSITGTIGVPRQSSDGASLWLLEGNTLVLLRVFEVGGLAMRITLTRVGSKMSCSTTAPMARELGAGNSKTVAAVGGKVEMLSMRQTSSTCHVKLP